MQPPGVADAPSLIRRSDFQWNLLRNFGSGIGEGDPEVDHAALQDFFDACGDAGDAVGIIPPTPSGVAYQATDTLVLPAYAHIEGPDPAARYFGVASLSPRSAGAIELAAGSTATALIRPTSTFTAGSLRNVVLLGRNRLNQSGQPVHGIWFDSPVTESAFRAENIAIIGMSGDGIRGTLWAQRWSQGLYVGGCGGYGIHITGTDRATDVWIHQAVINGCRAGGINIDSTGGSGMVHVTGRTRIERSGWDPATNGLAAGATAGAAGLRIRGNLLNSSFNLTTDANSGPGVSIVRVTGRSIHDLHVSGVLARDGWYNMTSGGSGQANPQRGLEVVGYAGGSIDRIDLTGLSVTGGKARDDGASPAYYHPAVGVYLDQVSFVTWPDVQIDSGIATPLTFGEKPWRSSIAGRPGGTTVDIGPVYATAADRPGSSGQPPAVKGMFGWDDASGLPIWFNGSTWVVVGGGGGGGAPTGSAGGSLAGTYPNPTLAANSVGASQITDGTIGNAEIAPAAAIAMSKLAAPTGAFSFGGQKLTDLGTPTGAADAATKAYVDSVGGGGGDSRLNVLNFLAGNGGPESEASIANLMAAWASTKKRLYWPGEGSYLIPANTLKVPAYGLTMEGDGLNTVISKSGNGWLLDASGANRWDLQNGFTMRDLKLYAGTTTGTLLRCWFNTESHFERVVLSGHPDGNGSGIDAVQWWDTLCDKVALENVGSATEPGIRIRAAGAATDGTFGYSADNSNALKFFACRIEGFHNGAIWIERGSAPGSNNHDIIFVGLKCETGKARGSFVKVDNTCNNIRFTLPYMFCGGFGSGYTDKFAMFDFAPYSSSTIRDGFFGASGDYLSSGVLLGGAGTTLDSLEGEFVAPPSSGFFVAAAGATGVSATKITTTHGTALQTPSSWATVYP